MNVYRKDGKLYLFNSHFEKLNFAYGVTPEIKSIVKKQLEKNINFLKNSYIEIDGSNEVTLFDCSMAANIQPQKYHAELYNRINTMRKIAKNKGFDTPIFITLTPPSYLKPLKQVKLKSKDTYKLVDNPKFNGDEDYIQKSRDYLTDIWCKFLRLKIFGKMHKEFNERMIFLRTYEPFLDGSCHAHIVLFIPGKYKERFVKLAKGYFKTKTDIKTEFKGNIGGVVAYLLKYVLKTFINGKNGDLSDIAYWYIYNKIRRFSTSRTLLPMHFYRKIKGRDFLQDLEEMTNLYNNGYISCDLIADPFKMASGEKMLSTDFTIDAIIVSINGFYETIHYVAYKRNQSVKLVLPDREIGVNGLQAKLQKPTAKAKDLRQYNKSVNRNMAMSKKDLQHFYRYDSPKDKNYYTMSDFEIVQEYLYLTNFYNDEFNNPVKLAILENEMLDRDLNNFTDETTYHYIGDSDELYNKFIDKEKMFLDF